MGHYGKAYSFIKIEPQTVRHNSELRSLKTAAIQFIQPNKVLTGQQLLQVSAVCPDIAPGGGNPGPGLQPGTNLISEHRWHK